MEGIMDSYHMEHLES